MRIKNWKDLQHFKDRTPPWIKLYRNILDQRDIMMISDCSFRVLIGLWLLASEDKDLEGKLPSIQDISFRLRKTEKEITAALQELGAFIVFDDIDLISPRYQGDAPETETYSKETEIKKKEGKKTLPLPDWLPIDDWNDYLEMRDKKGKGKATYRAKQLVIMKLIELREQGHDPTEVLQQSIINGWTSVFAIKKDFNNGNYKNKPSAHDNFTAGIALALAEADNEPRY